MESQGEGGGWGGVCVGYITFTPAPTRHATAALAAWRRFMCWLPNDQVSDGSQPAMTFDFSVSESAGSRSLDRLVCA